MGGAILGKVTPSQLVVMAVMESVVFWINIHCSITKIEAHDVGGGMVVHTFGAYFGLAVALSFSEKSYHGHADNCSNYTSDVTALAGTIFLWVLWPSFGAAVAATEKEQSLAVVNTFVCLCACTVSAAIFSRLLNGHKFDAVHLQNATLAGGVAMGVAGDVDIGLHCAVIAGLAAGAISCFGYAKVSPLVTRIGAQDICGVHNLHGMPGLLSAIIGIGAMKKPLPQLYATLITLAFALVGGTITGLAMRGFGRVIGINQERDDHFNDLTFWCTPSDYGMVVDEEETAKANADEATEDAIGA